MTAKLDSHFKVHKVLEKGISSNKEYLKNVQHFLILNKLIIEKLKFIYFAIVKVYRHLIVFYLIESFICEDYLAEQNV